MSNNREEMPRGNQPSKGREGMDRAEIAKNISEIRCPFSLFAKDIDFKIADYVIDKVKEARVEVLEQYTQWLLKHGYCDTDVICEEPYAISEFLKQLEETRQ